MEASETPDNDTLYGQWSFPLPRRSCQMHHGDCQDACFTGFTARPPRHAENEEVDYAGWQLACLLACGAASFDIALTEHVTSACVRDQPALIRLLTGLEDLDGFLTKLQQRFAGWRKTGHEQLQL